MKPVEVSYFDNQFNLVADPDQAAIAKVRFADGSVKFATLDDDQEQPAQQTQDKASWQEQLHPRGGKGSGAGGKFTSKGEAAKPAYGSKRPKAAPTKPQAAKPQIVHEEPLNLGSEAADLPRLKKTGKRAYSGEQIETATRLTKLETDAEGQRIAIAYLRSVGFKNARSANTKGNNFPIDIFADHRAIELKSGQVSNSKGAQQFRVTLGQPGKAETELLKRMSPEEKLAHNTKKLDEAVRRKFNVAEKHGMATQTMTVLFNPDTKHADIFLLDGYHKRIGWNSKQLSEAYVGSFHYE